MARYDHTFIAMDTETGGLPSEKKGTKGTIDIALTEVAMVAIDNESLRIIDKGSWLIKPYSNDLIYDKGAEIASGISKEMCEKEGIELEDVYENMKKFLKKHKNGRNKPILVFHNKPFDTPFIENVFLLFKDNLYNYIDRIECTLELSRTKFIEKPKFNLGAVAEMFGLDHTQAHRALPDTIITAEVWIGLMKCLRSEASGKQEENKFRHTFKF